MKTRKKLNEEFKRYGTAERLTLEVLLDIRDLLITAYLDRYETSPLHTHKVDLPKEESIV